MRGWTAPLMLVFFVSACSEDVDAPATPWATEPTPEGAWRSELYPEDWTPTFSGPDGAFLHDFSWAGYRQGGALPDRWPEPMRSVLDFGADPTGAQESTAAVQAAIDALESGGTLWFPEGNYTFDGPLRIRRSNVVLGGPGPDRARLHFRRDRDHASSAEIRFEGEERLGDRVMLTRDGESRAHWVDVASSEGFIPGDPVAIGWIITEDFVEEHRMAGTWRVFLDQPKLFFRRTVTAVEPGRVRVDVPLRYASRVRDGAFLVRDEGYLRDVGLGGLGISTVVDEDAAWGTNRHHAIALHRVHDGWVRDVASFSPDGGPHHLQSGGIFVEDSRQITLADLDLRLPQNIGSGGNGYLVEVSRSNEVLVRDAIAVAGRHNFIQNWDFGTSGCVWLRTSSREGRAQDTRTSPSQVGFSEYHHSLAIANLVDHSETDDGWAAKNRRTFSSGAGHTATESVFWNLRGTGELHSWQWGLGYVIGTGPHLRVRYRMRDFDIFSGMLHTEPEDWVEGLGEAARLWPPSLYEDQRARRLAREAE